MLKNLTKDEMINIDGGHDGTAYEAGAAVGKFLNKAAVVIGLVAVFIIPKGS
ncbi:hypothetical protein [Empedobacter stercoris]|uniref:hypothetical protein n=1 Tax=Empedobacter stercoris TaxID=1628248 RepID=UPI0039EBE27C